MNGKYIWYCMSIDVYSIDSISPPFMTLAVYSWIGMANKRLFPHFLMHLMPSQFSKSSANEKQGLVPENVPIPDDQ
jgi:hypothetical protein